MGSDSTSNAPLPGLCKDFGKKKRTNRLAKLKQSKLDVRREQWLSQVKNQEFKVHSNEMPESPPLSMQTIDKQDGSLDNSERILRGDDNKCLGTQEGNVGSLMKSLFGSGLDHDDSRKSHCRTNSSSSSIRSSYCSDRASEEESCCLDDWEAVADAMNGDDIPHSPISNPSVECETGDVSADFEQSKNCVGLDKIVCDSRTKGRAWRPDDAFRPRSLPSLSKHSANSDWYHGHEATAWTWQRFMLHSSSCPICYEDLDLTDSSFLPCSCGFQLCLFCHKRILETDGRCPGCRKQYDPMNWDVEINGGATTFLVTHSSLHAIQ